MLLLFCRICIIAGDISPIDVVTHLPVLCEDHDIPYIYVPSKEVLLLLLLPGISVFVQMWALVWPFMLAA